MRLALFYLLSVLAVSSSARAQTPLTLDVATDRDLYSADVSGTVYVEVRVGTAPPKPSEATPAPVTARNIAFVLDRSGSMDGEPLASARKALAEAIAALSPRDIVSVVLFGSEVETLVEAGRRDQLENLAALLDGIATSGGSALYDALNQGAAQLRRHADPRTSNHLILITDGPPTKGPREPDDFARLAEAFALEGIVFSTIGLGLDFNEDVLVSLARAGGGRFRFADAPEKIGDAVRAEVVPPRALAARDATLTLEFNPRTEKIETYGWAPPTIKKTTVTYRLPFVFAGRDVRLFFSAEIRPFRFSYDLAKIRLSWTDPVEGKTHEVLKPLSVMLETSAEAVRLSARDEIVPASVAALLSSGMQDAIEQIDQGDFRRALTLLRRARNEARSLNFDPTHPEVAAKIQRLDAYIAEVQARGMTLLDRKILRSGLFGEFDTPTVGGSTKR